MHIGSQIMELDPFERAYSALLSFGTALRDEGLEVPVLDLGGGIGVDYQHGTPTDFTAYGELVSRLFADSGFRLGFEPGRSIVANNGVLLTRVIYVKDGDNKRFAIVDAATNDLLRPTLYEAPRSIFRLLFLSVRESRWLCDRAGCGVRSYTYSLLFHTTKTTAISLDSDWSLW